MNIIKIVLTMALFCVVLSILMKNKAAGSFSRKIKPGPVNPSIKRTYTQHALPQKTKHAVILRPISSYVIIGGVLVVAMAIELLLAVMLLPDLFNWLLNCGFRIDPLWMYTTYSQGFNQQTTDVNRGIAFMMLAMGNSSALYASHVFGAFFRNLGAVLAILSLYGRLKFNEIKQILPVSLRSTGYKIGKIILMSGLWISAIIGSGAPLILVANVLFIGLISDYKPLGAFWVWMGLVFMIGLFYAAVGYGITIAFRGVGRPVLTDPVPGGLEDDETTGK